MSMIKTFSFVLPLAIAAVLTEYVPAQEAEGSISLFEKPEGQGGDSCQIPFKSGRYEMSSTGNCKNDQYSYFRLNSVPSAAKITFYSEGRCTISGNYDWYYTVRTYLEPTTTRLVSIPDEVASASPKQILVKGVRFEEGHYDHGNIRGKLSCVIIDKSDKVTP